MVGVLELAWASYVRRLNERPLETKSLTAAGVQVRFSFAPQCARACEHTYADPLSFPHAQQALAALVSQRAAGKAFSMERAVLMALFGYAWTPVMVAWQGLLGRWFGSKNVFLKTLFDQTIYGPAANVALAGFVLHVAERKPLGEVRATLRASFWATQRRAWTYWPIVSYVNYRFVRPDLRIAYLNAAGLVWSVWLTARTSARRAPKSS